MISNVIDLWALIHLFFFAFLASSIHVAWKPRWWVHVIWWLVISGAWETAEHFLQRRFTETWSGVIEHWANAWIADPVANGLGVIVGVLVAKWSLSRAKK